MSKVQILSFTLSNWNRTVRTFYTFDLKNFLSHFKIVKYEVQQLAAKEK